jgi:hypothetical protein
MLIYLQNTRISAKHRQPSQMHAITLYLPKRATIYQANHNLANQNNSLFLAPLLGPFMVHFIKYPATAGYFLHRNMDL